MTNQEKETMNHFLVNIFNEILKIEEHCISSSEFPNLSLREVHILETVCHIDEEKGDNSSAAIAAALHVTPGTLTTAVSLLERKGFLVRSKDPLDKRIVRITATEKGTLAQKGHDQFHHEMIEEILNTLTDEEAEIFTKALIKLGYFFENSYHSTPEKNNGGSL